MTPHAPFTQRIGALAFRERLTRYAGGWLGPYWAQITPLVWIAFLVILFQLLNRAPPILTHPAIFVATGVLPYLLLRQMVTSLARSVIAHRHLRNIQPVCHNDILVGTGFIEALNLVVSVCLIFGLLVSIDMAPLPNNPAAVALAFLQLLFLSWGLGRLIAIVGLLSDSWARIFPIVLRPLFWISGIFYTATELPLALREWLSWNPLFHITEAVRDGYFGGYTSPFESSLYPTLCAAVLFLMSTSIETVMHQRNAERYRL